MKPTSVVLFRKGVADLWLTGAKYFDDGSIRSGVVENGNWKFEVRNGEALAKNGNHIVNRWPLPDYEVFPAPRGRDYNAVLNHAQLIYDKQ